jgi:anti-sigma-K factor RskA
MPESSLNHTDVIDLIPGYALGSLAEHEARPVALHLESCTACRDELSAYEDLMAGIAMAEIPQVTAPASLQQRVMQQIQPPPSPAISIPERQSLWQRLRLPQLSLGLAGAVALLVLFVIAAAVWTQGAEPSLPRTVQMRGTENAPDAEALFEANAQGTEATLRVSGLMPLDPSQQYQLWLVNPDGSRDSGAVFSVQEDGSAVVHIIPTVRFNQYQRLGVTIEPAGGSPGPTGPQVLAGS